AQAPAPNQPQPPAMTLTEALAYSSAHQPEIRRALAEISARQAEARVPHAAWFPRASMQAQWVIGTTNATTGSLINVHGVEVPGVSSTPLSPSTSWTPAPSAIVAANATQQLYEFGRIAALSALADARTDVARASAATVELNIALGVEETYNAVLAAQHILK